MKKKYSLKIFLYAVLGGTILASGCAISAFSFAWFSNNNNVTRGFGGSTTGAYFARGNGSVTSPYVINRPIHLYNLAWLHYVGFFKGEEPYFIIERDLDMSGWTLPPIGTAENPFLGHLDGYDTVHSEGQSSTAKISNLTISNSFEKYNGKHPSSQTLSTFVSPEIIGLFGVIGDKTSAIEPSVKNLYLNKIAIDSTTNNALSGVVAGYVNGALSDIRINDSSLNLKDGTNKLSGYDSISKYTSVGYCEPNYQTTYVKNNTTMYEPQYVGNASFNPTGGSGGEDQGWGGSIDILSISKRVSYMTKVLTPTQNYHSFASDIYHLYVGKTLVNDNPYNWDDDNGTSAMLMGNGLYESYDGTYLPLNITNKIDETFYKSDLIQPEEVSPTNTGYLTGGGGTSSNATARLRNQKTNKNSQGIKNSFASFSNNRESMFNGSNFSFAYYDGKTGNHYRLIDEENKDTTFSASDITQTIDSSNLYGYATVKNNLLSNLNAVTKDNFLEKNSINVPGLLLRYQKNLNVNSRPSVSINGKNYTSYDLYDGGINFTLKEVGHISFVVGTYNTSLPSYFFRLFSLSRTENGTVSSIDTTKTKEIAKISSYNGKIGYQYSNGETTTNYSNSNLNFDFTKLNSSSSGTLKNSYAYFLEFPLEEGDYFLTSLPDKNNVPYILYLDIGANAGGTAGRKVDRTKVYELLEQISEGFTYPTGVAIVDFDNAVNDVKKLTITVGATYSGKVTFNYNGNNNAQISVNSSNSDTGLAYFDENMTINNGAITDSQVHGTITNTETQRLTYFDYDKETKITNVLTFSQTRESSSSAWGETKREDYQSGEGNTTFVGVSNLTIYGDDGKSTTDLPEIVVPKINKNTNVFKLKMLTPLEQPLEANWLPLGNIPTEEDAANYYFTLTGYDFTLKKSTEALNPSDYSIIKNANYALSVNGKTI